ncbi:MAG: ATP-binding protein [Cyclobacteriaceae bacterium]|nr:ATP-binding protein [Cyclobacteriaceae bacterium]
MKTSVIRICFYGPESTGKSTLATKMAEKYHTEFVPEVAREMVTSNQFTEEDIIRIGKEQVKRILEKTTTANRILFCDTDLITTQIYSEVYLKKVPAILFELEKQVPMDQYFLFDIDVPWVPDGLRDLGDRRTDMLALFRQKLEERGIDFITLSGTYAEREWKIGAWVEKRMRTQK